MQWQKYTIPFFYHLVTHCQCLVIVTRSWLLTRPPFLSTIFWLCFRFADRSKWNGCIWKRKANSIINETHFEDKAGKTYKLQPDRNGTNQRHSHSLPLPLPLPLSTIIYLVLEDCLVNNVYCTEWCNKFLYEANWSTKTISIVGGKKSIWMANKTHKKSIGEKTDIRVKYKPAICVVIWCL